MGLFLFILVISKYLKGTEVMRRKTNEEFTEEVQNLVGEEFIPLTTYKNSKIKVAFYHIDCGNVFYMTPNSFLRGQRCPKCGLVSRVLKQTYTQEDFNKKIAKVNHERYVVLSKYTFANERLDVKCLKCGRIFHPIAHNLFRGTGCPYCNHAVSVPSDDFYRRVESKNNGQFKFLDSYQGNEVRIRCQCNKCGYVWMITPHSFYHLKGCPRCQTYHVYTKDEYNYKLNKIYHGEYILVEDYKPQKRLLFKHNICGHTFIAQPTGLLKNNTGCPYCNESTGEKCIKSVLDKMGIAYEIQKRFEQCRYKRTLPFDFWLPKVGVAIEYDGIQHFQRNHFQRTVDDFREAKLRDSIKDWFCISHGIYLIRIPYKIKTLQDIEKFLSVIL